MGSPMEGLHYSPVGSPGSPSSLEMARSSSPTTLNPFAPQFARKNSFPERAGNLSPPPGLVKRQEAVDSFSMVTQSFVKEPIPIPVQPVPKSALSVSYKGSKETAKSGAKEFMEELPVISKNKLQFLVFEDEEEEKQESVSDSLENFLRDNELLHLHKKFANFGITKDDMKSLTDISLQQLGIFGEDNVKMLQAVRRIKP
eukprot:TRINITY_DN7866_c0_g2_i2.p1 TRINITY_DN7866_c0_g2~~TRINITY_DN7866_c0_g2_i2.p1  ORF type:complete len:200 (+),score=60.25 TRINITY_DN7866_c0_g2_i2:108-707(+)